MKFICEIFSLMSVIFRDEFNEPSSIMIGYSDTIVITPNHPPNRTVKGLINYSNCYSPIVVEVIL